MFFCLIFSNIAASKCNPAVGAATAVAAPTAGLHFDAAIFEKIKQKNIKIAYLTLHVGVGTFKPVTVENVLDHHMHFERYYFPSETAVSDGK